MDRQKVAIYGAGAMGTTLGVLLTLGGVDVHLISRNARHVQAMQEKGATVHCVADGKTLTAKVKALAPEEIQDRYDVIFLMTKQKDNAKIAITLKNHLTEEGIVCTTQNGLPELSLVEALGEDKVFGGVASWGANFLGDGEVELTSVLSAMSIVVGGYQKNEEKTVRLISILSSATKVNGNENFVAKTDDLMGARWAKLAINSAFSSLSTLTGLTFGKISKKAKTRKIALRLLRETYEVAEAAGVQVEKVQGHDLKKLLGGRTLMGKLRGYCLLPLAMKKHQKLLSGMLKDVQNGKKCEIDYISGVVGRLGRQTGVATPATDQVVEMIHGIENGFYEIAPENIDFFN